MGGRGRRERGRETEGKGKGGRKGGGRERGREAELKQYGRRGGKKKWQKLFMEVEKEEEGTPCTVHQIHNSHN